MYTCLLESVSALLPVELGLYGVGQDEACRNAAHMYRTAVGPDDTSSLLAGSCKRAAGIDNDNQNCLWNCITHTFNFCGADMLSIGSVKVDEDSPRLLAVLVVCRHRAAAKRNQCIPVKAYQLLPVFPKVT